MLHAGMRSTHGRDGRLVQMLLAGQGKMIEEMQAQTDVLLEMRNDQRELLKLQKERSETAAAAREEPATLDSTEVRAMPFPGISLQPRMHGICSRAIRGGRGVCSMRLRPA